MVEAQDLAGSLATINTTTVLTKTWTSSITSSRVMLRIFFLSFLKLIGLLKSPLDQNSIVIHYKFNVDFKSNINFEKTKRWSVALLISSILQVLVFIEW